MVKKYSGRTFYRGQDYEMDLFGKSPIRSGTTVDKALRELEDEQGLKLKLQKLIGARMILSREEQEKGVVHSVAAVRAREEKIRELSLQIESIMQKLLQAVYKNYPLEQARAPRAQFARDLLIELEDQAQGFGEKAKFLFFNTVGTLLDKAGTDAVVVLVDDVRQMKYKGREPISISLDATLRVKEDSLHKMIVRNINPDPETDAEQDEYLEAVEALAKRMIRRFRKFDREESREIAEEVLKRMPRQRRRVSGEGAWRAWEQPGGMR